jgi:signal transduction histidine kinase
VLAHQGQIWMERTRPGWTVFVVNLPLANPQRELTANPV